jgi:hypothetical protein
VRNGHSATLDDVIDDVSDWCRILYNAVRHLTLAEANRRMDLVRMAHWLRSHRAAVNRVFRVSQGMRDLQPVSLQELRLVKADVKETVAQVKSVVSPGKPLDAEGKERVVRLVVQSLAAHEAGTPPRSARKSPKAGSARKSPR